MEGRAEPGSQHRRATGPGPRRSPRPTVKNTSTSAPGRERGNPLTHTRDRGGTRHPAVRRCVRLRAPTCVPFSKRRIPGHFP